MANVIISDTSCLIALSKIGELELLKNLFGEILITSTVKLEFGEVLPHWILVQDCNDKALEEKISKILDKGESSAIVLALEIKNSILIIDEYKGRKYAQSLDIEIIGTLGVLLLAKQKGILTNIESVVNKLSMNGFRISNSLLSLFKDT